MQMISMFSFSLALLGLLCSIMVVDGSRFADDGRKMKTDLFSSSSSPQRDVAAGSAPHGSPSRRMITDGGTGNNRTSSSLRRLPAVFATHDCRMFGGLVSASVSPTCCFSANIVAQRTLHDFGMAEKCKPAWDCDSDGFVPKPDFEQNALKQMCSEPSCVAATVNAMDGNWMTKQGSAQFASLCDDLLTGQPQGGVLELHRTNLKARLRANDEKGHWKDDECKKCRAKGKKALEEKGYFGKRSKMYGDLKSSTDKRFCAKAGGKEGQGLNQDHECYEPCCLGPAASCFPGQSQVMTRGGQMNLAEVELGEEILVELTPGQLEFAPLLSFLHRLPANPDQAYLEISLARPAGARFRASHTHLVFTCDLNQEHGVRLDKFVGDLQPGELLCGVDGQDVVPTEVLHVEHRRGDAYGMLAPITATGTVVIDGVVASNYASPSRNILLKHSLAHKTLLPLRAYYMFAWDQIWGRPFSSLLCTLTGWRQACAENGDLELHPFVSLLTDALHLERFVSRKL
eukprot:gnl/TRDRNA2_/TRDRNA2_80413_c0_seq1.p1 gnl/TRDRNA2_/TRDRNA2_80413_c0~~gnl/TRDRNA2_/TRDRNA2_80413_c0_seq1.p1  ORF type:complete len:514 (-),score=69.93 gnl/TRDRNA2_/TRDRNA2_80413_c0_seq1:149-1690(-)